MCIKGSQEISAFGLASGTVGIALSAVFYFAGAFVGGSQGWHATAICLMTLGGLSLVSIPTIGILIKRRIIRYKEEEDQRIKAATSIFTDSTSL